MEDLLSSLLLGMGGKKMAHATKLERQETAAGRLCLESLALLPSASFFSPSTNASLRGPPG